MRLIDADALIEKAKKDRDRWAIKSRCSGKTESALFAVCLAQDGMKYAMEMETVESVPVKHGHWMKVGEAMSDDMICSACGEVCNGIADPYEQYATDYCAMCGAKMDEVADNG